MRTYRKLPPCRISPGLLIGLSMLFLVFPLKWIFAWALAGMLHELFHIMALRVCDVTVYSVELGLGGARIKTAQMPAWKECICAIAGPLSGVLLFLAGRWLPHIAACAVLQTVLNLLPLADFDGGRFLNCLMQTILKKDAADRTSAVIEVICIALLLCGSIYALIVLKLGFLPLCAAAVLAYRRIASKFPCKRCQQIVQ